MESVNHNPAAAAPSAGALPSDMLKRTPLYDAHVQAGAKFTEFGGWEMPVRYSGLSEEHHTVRKAVGLFDVSHMGEILVEGPKAADFLQRVTSNDLRKLPIGRAQYALLLNEQGGVVDDIISYKMSDQKYFVCVNAANTEKDFAWLTRHNDEKAFLSNVSASYAQLAVQGPKARELVREVLGGSSQEFSPESFKPFDFRILKSRVAGHGEVEMIVACTGYTGEDGFEIFLPAEAGAAMWEELLARGAKVGIAPIGLGARDTLRLEVCYPLHGHELRDDICALWSNVGWVIKLKKGDFIGREALLEAQRRGLEKKLVGLELVDRGIVRADASLYDGDRNIGWTTSGTQPPTVNRPVALAYVEVAKSQVGTEFDADVRGKRLKVRVIELPFLRRD